MKSKRVGPFVKQKRNAGARRSRRASTAADIFHASKKSSAPLERGRGLIVCNSSRASSSARNHAGRSGPCRSGWVHRRWVGSLAGIIVWPGKRLCVFALNQRRIECSKGGRLSDRDAASFRPALACRAFECPLHLMKSRAGHAIFDTCSCGHRGTERPDRAAAAEVFPVSSTLPSRKAFPGQASSRSSETASNVVYEHFHEENGG